MNRDNPGLPVHVSNMLPADPASYCTYVGVRNTVDCRQLFVVQITGPNSDNIDFSKLNSTIAFALLVLL